MRSKFGCSGYTTLLVTSILLLFALITSLASSKGVFFQLKVAQNELKARQEHWKAEGGLECAFAQIKEKMLVSSSFRNNYFTRLYSIYYDKKAQRL